MRFVLIRHGESGNNLLWQQTGADVGRHPDTPLTELGKQQAKALAAYAVDPGLPWRPTHLYTSPMARAVQTAAPLADALDLPLVPHPDLFEVGGPYDVVGENRRQVPHPGSGRPDLASLSPRLTLPDWITDAGWWTGEVESTEEQLPVRAGRVVDGLRTTHADDDVVALVSHAAFGNVLLRRLLGIETIAGWFEIANTAITLVEDAVPEARWPTDAVRINWLPHLRPDEVTGSAVTG